MKKSCKIVRKQLTNAVFFAKIFSVSVRKRHSYALLRRIFAVSTSVFISKTALNSRFL